MTVVSPQEGGPSGPGQTGRGCNGQYVYWIVMVQPAIEVLQRHGLKKLDEHTRKNFGKLIVKAHKDGAVKVVETACLMEPRASGLIYSFPVW